MAENKPRQKTRAHKESKGGSRGARKTKLSQLDKFLIGGKSTRGMRRAGKRKALTVESNF